MHRLIKFIPFASFLAPLAVLAQSPGLTGTSYFSVLGAQVITFINGVLVPLVVALAVIVFIWGVFQYFILGAGSEEKRETGKTYMLYGIFGFVIIVALWGIVQIFISLFGLTAGAGPLGLPNAPTSNP